MVEINPGRPGGEPEMKAFAISVNGKRCCTIGVGTSGVLSATLIWVSPGFEDRFDLHASGLAGSTNEHLTWAVPSIEMGDQVTLEITEADNFDEPFDRYPAEPHQGRWPT
jgi:hypothetical protein